MGKLIDYEGVYPCLWIDYDVITNIMINYDGPSFKACHTLSQPGLT